MSDLTIFCLALIETFVINPYLPDIKIGHLVSWRNWKWLKIIR